MADGSDQPVAHVEWLPREALRANSYNPNHVAPVELDLLRQSIIADGWTQPIVARENGEIVDGFHRWTVAGDEAVAALTDGLVPVVRLTGKTEAEQMAATVRHNRARGTHGIVPMGSIVRALIDDHGYDAGGLAVALGMEDEEVDRLYDTRGMTARASAKELGNGWKPTAAR